MLDAVNLALIYLLAEWAIRIVMVVIIPMRRPAEAARSWLLLVLFLPVPALLLYRMIGRARFPRWRHERFIHSRKAWAPIARQIARGGQETDQIARLATQLGSFPPCEGNRIDLMTDYAATIDAMVAAIEAAEESVHLLTYILADDETGRRVVEALGRAVARGVRVRVLFDALGSRPWAKRSMALLRDAGVEAKLVLPIRFAPLHRARGDLRNHRKLCVVDGRLAFTGSQNIVDRDFKPGIVNDELVARVEGPVVAALDAVFVSDWYLETLEEIPSPALPTRHGEAVVQAMPSGPDFGVPGYERLLVELVHGAEERIAIVSPYLIPDEALLTALKNAVARGVTVDLIVSHVIDQHLVRLAQRSYYDEMLEAGIRLHRYRDRLLHAKSVAMDGRTGIIGSSNADVRSFMLNAEISLILYGADSIAPLDRVHADYARGSDRLTLEEWRRRPRPLRLLENLARLLSPLL